MADTIATLAALDDAALTKKLGLDNKVAEFRANLERAAKLPDAQKKDVELKLAKMFGPQEYAVNDFSWTVKDAERDAKRAASTGVKGEDCGAMLKSFDCCDCAQESIH